MSIEWCDRDCRKTSAQCRKKQKQKKKKLFLYRDQATTQWRYSEINSVELSWRLQLDKGLKSIEPSHEIMVLFVLRKLILQTSMRNHPVWLGVWLLVGPFVYFHTSCVRTAKPLVRLRGYGSPEPSLVAHVISTIMSWVAQFRKDAVILSFRSTLSQRKCEFLAL